MEKTSQHPLSHGELLELKRWNTPTIYNGWEQITKLDAGKDAFNLEECRDFMPEMGPMVGYAVTVVIEPSNKEHPRRNPKAWSEYRRYVASISSPKIVVVQDLVRLSSGRRTTEKQLNSQCRLDKEHSNSTVSQRSNPNLKELC